MRTLILTKKHARLLLLNLEGDQLDRSERKKLRKIEEALDPLIADYTNEIEGLIADKKVRRRKARTIPDVGARNLELSLIEEDINDRAEVVDKTLGGKKAEITLEDDWFTFAKSTWDEIQKQGGSREIHDFIDEVDEAFEKAKVVTLKDMNELKSIKGRKDKKFLDSPTETDEQPVMAV